MSRRKQVIRNMILIVILFSLLIWRSGLYISPISAHKSSERSIHYGPSEIVHIEDFDGGKYFLCKYDKWVSCNTINRTLLFFWSFGSQVTGFENDRTKAVSYTWGMSNQNNKTYGIINDSRIKKIEIKLRDGTTMTQTDFYYDMFLFNWKSSEYGFDLIRGYDEDNHVLFEEDL